MYIILEEKSLCKTKIIKFSVFWSKKSQSKCTTKGLRRRYFVFREKSHSVHTQKRWRSLRLLAGEASDCDKLGTLKRKINLKTTLN